MSYKIFEYDPALLPYEQDINLRMENYYSTKNRLLSNGQSLTNFANAHEYFGFHKTQDGWFYREWAPAAEQVYLTGDFNNWQWLEYPLNNIGNGVWEIFIKDANTLYNGCHIKTIVKHDGKLLERIPLYARRVEQNPVDYSWCAVIVDLPEYKWKRKKFTPKKNIFVYECHIGMAQEEQKIGSYKEFCDKILPRVKQAGYNTIQIMAIMEHPYYGSFGYQVSSFFAPSSKFGNENELKELIDKAHSLGIAVLLDLVHSHAVKNTAEGINEFDGTTYQFFHQGEKGDHPAWGTKLFNYGKDEVLHFLLSNLKYWLTNFKFDGFRFDGVTSMIYHDHGLGSAFTDYGKYFSLNTHTEAITYLQLATTLIREVNPNAIIIAEDMSAMPGMCLPIEDGGIGFDYRLAMGTPDLWIKLIKEQPDEFWNVWHIWHELSSRRPKEKYIAYAESHDQALVGDKTIIFRLCDKAMYTDMNKSSDNGVIARGLALHKMIRMITLGAGGEGYLNFMGNEFGHPEWIDFPREGNGWSYFYCRRQWHLADDKNLKYHYLADFDKDMLAICKKRKIFINPAKTLCLDADKQVLAFKRGGLIMLFNFSPTNSYDGYCLKVPTKGVYKVALSSDDYCYGGFGRVAHAVEYTAQKNENGEYFISIYAPTRTAISIVKIKK
ncbi:MAG: alpha amylase C-terminal domain-containing protein [Clostridia bacterium]|nr:alpha amylase C-terminal domain-containing protein [Clostridia bacterium]